VGDLTKSVPSTDSECPETIHGVLHIPFGYFSAGIMDVVGPYMSLARLPSLLRLFDSGFSHDAILFIADTEQRKRAILRPHLSPQSGRDDEFQAFSDWVRATYQLEIPEEWIRLFREDLFPHRRVFRDPSRIVPLHQKILGEFPDPYTLALMTSATTPQFMRPESPNPDRIFRDMLFCRGSRMTATESSTHVSR